VASRKEQKEAAREQRVAELQAREERRQRTRRLQMLAGVVIAAIAVVAVAIAISSNGSDSGATGLQPGPRQSATKRLVDDELAGIPQSGAQLGSPRAPVTMIYYGDLECPYCAAFTTGADGGGLPQLISHQVRDGQVKVQYRPFCTATCNDSGEGLFDTQQTDALSAGLQHRFWYYTELFYREQGAEGSGYVTPAFLHALAAQVPGLELGRWESAQSQPRLLAQVRAGEADASAAGLSGTPAVIIDGPKGTQRVSGSIPTYSELEQTVAQVR
jgi:protein-disulfide isomerase